jgi:hypothetical protein
MQAPPMPKPPTAISTIAPAAATISPQLLAPTVAMTVPLIGITSPVEASAQTWLRRERDHSADQFAMVPPCDRVSKDVFQSAVFELQRHTRYFKYDTYKEPFYTFFVIKFRDFMLESRLAKIDAIIRECGIPETGTIKSYTNCTLPSDFMQVELTALMSTCYAPIAKLLFKPISSAMEKAILPSESIFQKWKSNIVITTAETRLLLQHLCESLKRSTYETPYTPFYLHCMLAQSDNAKAIQYNRLILNMIFSKITVFGELALRTAIHDVELRFATCLPRLSNKWY